MSHQGTRKVLRVALCLWLASVVLAQEPILNGTCVGVTDGDTIRVLTADKQQLRIRLAWIDAPERGQAFASKAKQAMSELVFGKDVELRPHTTDRYGRLVCLVIVEGKDTGLELLKRGLCWCYEHYLPEAPTDVQQSYRAAESAARNNDLGLWIDANPQPPWKHRQTERARLGGQ
jgi:endonuclease YncB( thermonuclease family)